MRFLMVFWCLSFWSFYVAAAPRVELAFEKAVFDHGDLELSGITFFNGKWLVVSDDGSDHFVYEVKPKQKRFDVKKFIDLSNIATGTTKIDRLDLEGITTCEDTIYLADERVRQIIQIEPGQKPERLKIDFSAYPELFVGDVNAGFEGVAADCANKIMFVAKERDKRFIIRVDMNTWKVIDVKDFELSDRSGQKAIDFKNDAAGLMELSSDASDLYFENGFLYVLERNNYDVTKIDAKTLQVVAHASFFKTLKDLYSTGEPFGLAEALYMTKDVLVIGVDNNHQPLSVIAEAKFKVKGAHPGLFFFKRPNGF